MEVESNKKGKTLDRGSPYNVLWRADLRFYLSQGLATAGFKIIVDIKEAMSRKNDRKRVKAELIELQTLICKIIKAYQRLGCLEVKLDQST